MREDKKISLSRQGGKVASDIGALCRLRKIITNLARLVALAVCLICLSACSPYIYNQEITSFSSGINSTVSSYQAGQKLVAALVLQDQEADYVKARARLTLENGCLDPTASPTALPGCSVTPLPGAPSPLTERTTKELAAQAQVAKAAQTFDSLKTYAAALLAVINATDDTSLKQASQNLGTSVGTFSTAVAKVVPEAVLLDTMVSSATNLIDMGVTTYLEEQKFMTLQATVPDMDAPVTAAGKVMEDALLSIRQVQLAHMAEGLKTAKEPFETGDAGTLNEAEYKTRLAALLSQVTAFNQARASNPATTISAMLKAHKQLVTALLNHTGKSEAVMTAARNFATAAEQLRTSFAAGSSTAVTGEAKAVETQQAAASRK